MNNKYTTVPGKVGRVVNSRHDHDHDDGQHDDVKTKGGRGQRAPKDSKSLSLSLSLPFFTLRLPLFYDDATSLPSSFVIVAPDLGHRASERAGEGERGNERVCH